MTMTDEPLGAGRVDSVDDRNRPWNLKSFMDSLIVELDRAQDVLAVKGLTRPVTYTVKDVDVDLRCFPQFDGRSVRFRTAQPGQDGSSGLRFSLGSISAGTIRDSAPPPPEPGDIRLDAVEDLDQDTIEALESVGVRSGRDLQRVAARGVDLKSATGNKAPEYSDLAAMITKATRRRLTPKIHSASLSASADDGRPVLHLDGENLCIDRAAGYPYALVDGRPAPVRAAAPDRISLEAPGPSASRVAMALDPYALVTMELRRDVGFTMEVSG
jgi:hypothetical protein